MKKNGGKIAGSRHENIEQLKQLFLCSADVMSFDELPHVLRRGPDAVFCQFLRDCSCTFSFSPHGKDLFPEREQSASSRSMFYRMTGESADDIQLFRAIMPVFG